MFCVKAIRTQNRPLSYYDADGLRGSKTVNGTKTTYYYVGDKLMYESRGNGIELYFFYDSLDKLSVIRYINGDKDYYFYVTTNAQGDVLGIYSSAGVLKASYEYDAWGNCEITSDTSGINIANVNPIRYRGYYFDSDTGLYYLQSRYYDPEIGRFINADKYLATGEHVLSLNMFAYCGNNPINYSDPTGHWPEFINKIIDAVKSAISNIETAIQNIGVVQHDVPLYSQGDRPLCWAYSQTMVEDFQSGTQRTQEEADGRAQEIAVSVHGEDNWNQGGWPTNIGSEASSTNIFALYWNLRDGPLYGHYGVSNTDGHMVVITGVSVFRDEVYTNNPWGVSGTQSFDEFCEGYVDLEGGNTGVPLIAAYTYE